MDIANEPFLLERLMLSLLTQPPGNWIYHLVIAFSLAALLQLAHLQRRWTPYPQTDRLFLGVLLLLVARTGVLLASLWVLSPAGQYALNWLLYTLSLLAFTWLWAFPEPRGKADWASGLVGASLLSLGGFSVWAFNHTAGFALRWIWIGLSAFLGIGGLALLYLRRPAGLFYGAVSLSVMTLAGVAHGWLETTPPEASLLRLGELLTYPLLFSLLYRYSPALMSEPTERPAPPRVTIMPPATTHPAEQALRALLALLRTSNDQSTEQRWALIAEVAAHYLVADLCLLLAPVHTPNEVDVLQGFDLIQEQPIPAFGLQGDKLPIITSALRKGRPLRLPASSTSLDLDTLARALQLPQAGPLLLVPVPPTNTYPTAEAPPQDTPLGALLFTTPYSQRTWSNADLQRATELAQALTSVWAQGHNQAQQKELKQQLARLQEEHEQLLARWESARAHMEEINLLLDELERARARIAELEVENQQLKQAHYAPTDATDPRVEQLEHELRLALQEVATLRNELARADQKLLELEQSANGLVRSQVLWQSLRSLAQDLRQPLSAIVGYTELLLREQAGILGTLQREFVERIQGAAHQIDRLINDFLNLLALETGENVASQSSDEPLDLGQVLDEAITAQAYLLREKRLGLRVEIPPGLPKVRLPAEALRQIVAHLLHNALLASPEEGEVLVQARLLREGDEELVALTFTDSGGGIPFEDLPRVFSRIYRSSNRIIEGLGDNGVGLPLTKALVDSLGGRIWVESQPGQGSTFTVVLPLNIESGNNETTPSEEQDTNTEADEIQTSKAGNP